MDAPPSSPPASNSQKRDCLICFGTIRRSAIPWKQPTPVACACRPQVHRTCWESWAAQAGPVCVICRSQKYPPVAPVHRIQVVPNDGIVLFGRRLNTCSSTVFIVFVFYIVVLVLSQVQPPRHYPRMLPPALA
jgi:hypothetical protein